MLLKPIPYTKQNGTLDTAICIVENANTPENIENALHNFGSINNGGMSHLVQFVNQAFTLIMSKANAGNAAGIKRTYPFGITYLCAELANRLGATFKWDVNDLLNEDANISLMPSILTALLDSTEQSLSDINNVIITPKGQKLTDFNVAYINSLRSDMLPDLSNIDPVTTEILTERLRNWLNFSSFSRPTFEQNRKLEVIAKLALHIKLQAEQRLSANWEKITQQLRSLQLVLIELGTHQILSATQLSPSHVGMLVRLSVPFPPAMIVSVCKPPLRREIVVDELEIEESLAELLYTNQSTFSIV